MQNACFYLDSGKSKIVIWPGSESFLFILFLFLCSITNSSSTGLVLVSITFGSSLGISIFYVVGNQDNYVVMQNLTPL